MTIFNFNPEEGQPVMSSYIWVYFALGGGLTVITVAGWYITTMRVSTQQSDFGDTSGYRMV
jgi:hypothetical protein